MMASRRACHFGLRRDTSLASTLGMGATLAGGDRATGVYRLTSRYKPGKVQTMQADVNWCAVLAHHATRAPDTAITVFEGVTTTYGEMAARSAALAAGLAG